MRHFRIGEVDPSHRNSLDEHWHSKKSTCEQIGRSRELVAASKTLLAELTTNVEHPRIRAMLTHAECKAFATVFRARAAETDVPARSATIMKNIARSLSGLASQLEMLTETTGT
jgi:hypothetical protein